MNIALKRAYDELETEGWVATRRGRGTFVVEAGPERTEVERADALRPAARRLLLDAHLGAVEWSEMQRILKEERAPLRPAAE